MAAEADVHHLDAVSAGPVERRDEPAVVPRAVRAEHLEAPQSHLRGDPDDEVAVVVRGEDACHVGAVPVVVHRVGVVVHEVPAALVGPVELRVDDRGLERVGDVVDVVDAGVDDGDVDAVAADAGLVDPIRPDVLDAPGVLVFEVAGLCAVIEGDDRPVALDGRDVRVAAQASERGLGRGRREAGDDRVAVGDGAGRILDGTTRGLAPAFAERHDDLGTCLLAGRGRRTRRERRTGRRDRREERHDRQDGHARPGQTTGSFRSSHVCASVGDAAVRQPRHATPRAAPAQEERCGPAPDIQRRGGAAPVTPAALAPLSSHE